MRFVWWIVLVPVAVLVVGFAVINRAVVAVDLWPLGLSFRMPVFAVILASIIVGFVLGGVVFWTSGLARRRRARAAARRLQVVERELARLREQLDRAEARGRNGGHDVAAGLLPAPPRPDVAHESGSR